MTGAALRRVLVAVAALLVAGTLAAGGVITWAVATPVAPGGDGWPGKRVDDAVQAAKDCVVAMYSLSHKTIDGSVRAMADCTTGNFRKEVEGAAAKTREAVVSRQLETRCVVPLTAVADVGEDHVDVLVAADVVRTATDASQQTLRYRVDVRMVEVEGQWLAASMELLR